MVAGGVLVDHRVARAVDRAEIDVALVIHGDGSDLAAVRRRRALEGLDMGAIGGEDSDEGSQPANVDVVVGPDGDGLGSPEIAGALAFGAIAAEVDAVGGVAVHAVESTVEDVHDPARVDHDAGDIAEAAGGAVDGLIAEDHGFDEGEAGAGAAGDA